MDTGTVTINVSSRIWYVDKDNAGTADGRSATPFTSLAPLDASLTAFAAALAVGALSYGLSIALYIASAQELGATRAQGVFAAAPFIGAALSFMLLGEHFGIIEAAACALLVASIPALMLSQHAHVHIHEAMEHVHMHRHDDGHHLHDHSGLDPALRHSHVHRHERLVHAHPHWPDVHHRHRHTDQVRDPPIAAPSR